MDRFSAANVPANIFHDLGIYSLGQKPDFLDSTLAIRGESEREMGGKWSRVNQLW
jgi:hypothetical protein